MTTKYNGERTGMGHRKHPLLGLTVLDTTHDRVGILRAVAPELDTSLKPAFVPYNHENDVATIDTEPCVAWLAPPGGGPEWSTDVGALLKADEQ